MKVVAFDIETVPDLNGVNYRDFVYLKSRGRKDRKDEDMEREISFNPFTLFVVSVSTTTVEGEEIKESTVVYASDLKEERRSEEVYYAEGRAVKVDYVPVKTDFVEGKLYELEESVLHAFWEEVSRADKLVSFNGYGFDGYVLKIRSMIHGIDIPQRFLKDKKFHLDLLHFLSNGEREKRYSLDFVCRKFGINTPKDIIDGSKVAEEFYKGNYRTIALYNLKDSLALAQLYLKVKKYLADESVEEPPTENQMKYLVDLISQLTGIGQDEVKGVLTEFTEGGLNKKSVSVLIEIVRKLRDVPF